MTNHSDGERQDQPYESPKLVDYGTIEEWTLGRSQAIIQISLVL
jgi:hypothetical protein